jgi:hypothetical protein
MNCTEKFIKHSERIGTRFAELTAGTYITHLLSLLSDSPVEGVTGQPGAPSGSS